MTNAHSAPLTALIAYVDDLETRLSAVRAGYLDNINNANLATIEDISSLTATEIAYLDAKVSEVVKQVALTGHPSDSLGKILYDFYITRLTSDRCGYLANINNANLATIGDISTLTATEIAHLDADISSIAPSYPPITDAGVLAGVVTGDATNPERINDGETVDYVNGGGIDKYVEIDFGLKRLIMQCRVYGHVDTYAGNVLKVDYWNGSAWVNWIANIDGVNGAAWGSWFSGVAVETTKIRVICTVATTTRYTEFQMRA